MEEFIIKFNRLEILAALEACEFALDKMMGHDEDWRCKGWSKNKIDALDKAILKMKGH